MMTSSLSSVCIFTDGGARGNPGPAGIGVVITTPDGKVLRKIARFLGTATNNQAEYAALCAALTAARALGAHTVTCYLDSELVVKQMRREYKVRDKHLQQLFVQAWNRAAAFHSIRFIHIPREKNTLADSLVNHAIDNR